MKEDLYALWLGIAPGPRPPNHYDLLGVPLFSNDIDAIEKNTRAKIVQLDQYALHRDREKRNAVQEMMNQVAQARVCLVNPDRKAEYDASLARSLNVPLPAPPAPAATWVQEIAPATPSGQAQPAAVPARAPATAGQIDPVEIFRQRLRRHLLKWQLNPSEEMLLLAEADNLGIAPKLARRIIRQIDAECQDVAEEKSRIWTVGVAGFAVLAILIGAAFIFVPRWRQSQKEKEFADRLAIATRFLDAGLYDDMETELAQAEKILPGNQGIQEFRVRQADRMLALADAAARAEKPADARKLLDAIHRFASTDPRFRRLDAQVAALEKAAKDRQLAAENEKVQRQLADMVSRLQKGEFPAADAMVAPLSEDFSRWPHTAEFVRPALGAALTEMLKSSSWTAAAKTAETWAHLDADDETASAMIASAAKSLLESSRRHAAAGETDAARQAAQAILTLHPNSRDATGLLADLPAKAAKLAMAAKLAVYSLEKLAALPWPFDANEAARRQEAAAEAFGLKKEIALDVGNGVSMKLVLIPPGQFMMGSPENEPGRTADECPQHEVIISKPFYVGKYPVTQAGYEAVAKSNPCKFVGPRNPVEMVSWDEAAEFCRKASQKTGQTVRLPTEAEWEYACRAGTQTRYSFGDNADKLTDFAWFKDNSAQTTHPVGQKSPNAFGLHDMHGNVWQWCSDWYQRSYEDAQRVAPKGPTSGRERVRRGGSFENNADSCRSGYRNDSTPDYRFGTFGFRIVVEANLPAGYPASQPASAPATMPAVATVTPLTPPASQPAVISPGPIYGPHLGAVHMAVVDANAGTVLTACPNYVKLWDLKTGRQRLAIPGAVQSITGMLYKPLSLIQFSATKGSARPPLILDLAGGLAWPLQDSPEKIHPLPSRDGRYIATYDFSTPTVWETATGRRLTLDPMPAKEHLRVLVFAGDGRTMWGLGQTHFFVWTLNTGHLAATDMPGDLPSSGKTSIVVSEDKSRLFFMVNGCCHSWDLNTGKDIAAPKDATAGNPVDRLKIAPDGSAALLISKRQLSVWLTAQNRLVALETPASAAADFDRDWPNLMFSCTGEYVLWNQPGGTIVWTVSTGVARTLENPKLLGGSRACQFLPDGKTVFGTVSTHTSDGLATWDAATGKARLIPLPISGEVARDMRIGPKSTKAALVCSDAEGTLIVVDFQTGKTTVRKLGALDPKRVRSLNYNCDVVVLQGDTEVVSADLDSMAAPFHFPVHPGPLLRSNRLAGGGSVFLDQGADFIRIYDLKTGKLVSQLSDAAPASQPAIAPAPVAPQPASAPATQPAVATPAPAGPAASQPAATSAPAVATSAPSVATSAPAGGQFPAVRVVQMPDMPLDASSTILRDSPPVELCDVGGKSIVTLYLPAALRKPFDISNLNGLSEVHVLRGQNDLATVLIKDGKLFWQWKRINLGSDYGFARTTLMETLRYSTLHIVSPGGLEVDRVQMIEPMQATVELGEKGYTQTLPAPFWLCKPTAAVGGDWTAKDYGTGTLVTGPGGASFRVTLSSPDGLSIPVSLQLVSKGSASSIRAKLKDLDAKLEPIRKQMKALGVGPLDSDSVGSPDSAVSKKLKDMISNADGEIKEYRRVIGGVLRTYANTNHKAIRFTDKTTDELQAMRAKIPANVLPSLATGDGANLLEINASINAMNTVMGREPAMRTANQKANDLLRVKAQSEFLQASLSDAATTLQEMAALEQKIKGPSAHQEVPLRIVASKSGAVLAEYVVKIGGAGAAGAASRPAGVSQPATIQPASQPASQPWRPSF